MLNFKWFWYGDLLLVVALWLFHFPGSFSLSDLQCVTLLLTHVDIYHVQHTLLIHVVVSLGLPLTRHFGVCILTHTQKHDRYVCIFYFKYNLFITYVEVLHTYVYASFCESIQNEGNKTHFVIHNSVIIIIYQSVPHFWAQFAAIFRYYI